MNTDLKNKFTTILEGIIAEQEKRESNGIYVLIGLSPYVDIEAFADHITNRETFDKEGNKEVFDTIWVNKMLNRLQDARTYQILSHQQYAYLEYYNLDEPYKKRVVIIYDNLRMILPIKKEDFKETTNAEEDEKRPEDMPIYQAEQFQFGDKYYYSQILFDDDLKKQKFFEHPRKVEDGKPSTDSETVDLFSNLYSIDEFVNRCIEEDDFGKKIYVKFSRKNEFSKRDVDKLENINYLLGLYGGGVYKFEAEPIQTKYTPRDKTQELLRKYWGEEAKFYDLDFYENPDLNNEIVPISQGKIVETIIDEYENGRQGKSVRDIFITAPTGSGKSLIFQLPAFYAGEKGDVTIVVSPLIALMKDQVDKLREERHYERAAYLNSTLTILERQKTIEDCRNGLIDILYLSPELLLSYDIKYFIGDRMLGLLVVDEAHLITTWGRDFRVDYWFLGSHVDKIRKSKYYVYNFPIVALTATAVYGGDNAMVVDSCRSLGMEFPHEFIGKVRRDDIEFVVDTHEDYPASKYKQCKIEETINFIKGMHDLDLKCLVYVPFRRHTTILKAEADKIDKNMTVFYHGDMDRDEKTKAQDAFKNNLCKILISTKAFGMGMDIPDIQVVYHHTPSGLLADYVQEIGRAARKPDIQGYAALSFSNEDLNYSNQLFGISSLKQYQLREIMKKLIELYNLREGKGKDSKGNQNLLVSANDFSYIFDKIGEDEDQKASTALMMIEKDYIEKYQTSILTARPKKLFTKVYARTDDKGMNELRSRFGNCFEKKQSRKEHTIIELNLNDIWSQHFKEKSFPKFKNEFYKQELFNKEDILLIPQVEITININKTPDEVLSVLSRVISAIKNAFYNFKSGNHYFSKEDYEKKLKEEIERLDENGQIFKKTNAKKIAEFVLGAYSKRINDENKDRSDIFLRQKNDAFMITDKYYYKKFNLLTACAKVWEEMNGNTYTNYYPIGGSELRDRIRIGSLLDVMNLGTFETSGGSDPKIWIRLNKVNVIRRDAKNKNYKNGLLENVRMRHDISCELFKHFFTKYFTNEERWQLIEDFFLGMSNEDLFDKYPGRPKERVDIVEYIKTHTQK